MKIIPYLGGVNNEYSGDDILSQVSENSLSQLSLHPSVRISLYPQLIIDRAVQHSRGLVIVIIVRATHKPGIRQVEMNTNPTRADLL